MRLSGRGLRATLCVTLAAASFGGCTDLDTSLFIVGNLVATPPQCSVTADPSGDMLGKGSLDLAFNHVYTAALLVGNQMTPRGDKTQLRPETKRVNLQGAEVILTDLAGAVIEPAFSVPGAGYADVSSGDDPAYGVIFAELIPRTVGSRLAEDLEGDPNLRTIIAEVRVFGTAIGGHELESGPFIYPIQVCYGCSVLFPLVAMVPDSAGNLICGGDAEGVNEELPCAEGQDTMTDCRACVITHPDICLSPTQ